ncbi:MAG: choice-of-anchor L domain-containing protein [Nannocystaceae bacterium]|nr:choice-of-anchor L domain-containing protein [Nannocystaceae bacterium]
MEVGWRSAACCIALLSGCQVRGLVGSNESADDTADVSAASAGMGGSAGGADTFAPLPSGGTGGQGASGTQGGMGAESDDDASSSGDQQARFDVSSGDDSGVCAPPSFPACDSGDPQDLKWQRALGLCDGDSEAVFSQSTRPGAVAILTGRLGGPKSPYSPREGHSMVVLSTGDASELKLSPQGLRDKRPLECEDPLYCPSSDLGGERRGVLPAPMTWRSVEGEGDCTEDPSLIGGGDCSNSLADPWLGGDGAFDYGELRMRAEVPRFTDALQFDFAFFSSEYPAFTQDVDVAYNDMFVAWLESEAWTGNVSFDDSLQPITVHSVFMDYRSPSEACPHCSAPELKGFAMEHHAGTKWLTTKAPVVPGETIDLVFAIFDLTDATFDSMVLLDGFEWSCSSTRPITSEG